MKYRMKLEGIPRKSSTPRMLGSEMKRLRTSVLKWSRPKLALEMSNISPNLIYVWETGREPIPPGREGQFLKIVELEKLKREVARGTAG